jgi:hypothetical protein
MWPKKYFIFNLPSFLLGKGSNSFFFFLKNAPLGKGWY